MKPTPTPATHAIETLLCGDNGFADLATLNRCRGLAGVPVYMGSRFVCTGSFTATGFTVRCTNPRHGQATTCVQHGVAPSPSLEVRLAEAERQRDDALIVTDCAVNAIGRLMWHADAMAWVIRCALGQEPEPERAVALVKEWGPRVLRDAKEVGVTVEYTESTPLERDGTVVHPDVVLTETMTRVLAWADQAICRADTREYRARDTRMKAACAVVSIVREIKKGANKEWYGPQIDRVLADYDALFAGVEAGAERMGIVRELPAKVHVPEVVTRHYVVFSRSFCVSDDYDALPVPDRLSNTARPYPNGALSFQFFDQTEVQHGDEILKGEPRNRSGTYYIGGVVFTLATLPDTPDLAILRGNMTTNGWERVVRCRFGGWQPFEEDDVVVSPDMAPEVAP